MDRERLQKIEKFYHSALEIDPSQRHGFLDKACGDDDLRREVESLLAQRGSTGAALCLANALKTWPKT
ncbi:MAG TPA: hypothetical protein VIY49_34990 [Bryobacteraceae bacterium]